MDDQTKNLILASALSFGVILIWFTLFPPPEADPNAPAAVELVEGQEAATTPTADGEASIAQAEDVAEDNAPRLSIVTPSLEGSISLKGGRIDELSLRNYRETLAEDSPIVKLLSPIGSDKPYYALFGWAPGSGLSAEQVPDRDTIWSVEGNDNLTPETPVTLTWDNGAGLSFRRDVSIDDKFMFTIRQTVENTGEETVRLAPYGILERKGEPEDLKNFFILHEGAIRMVDGELTETDYDDFEPSNDFEKIGVNENAWTGFTDHYWMTTLIPADEAGAQISTLHHAASNIFHTSARQSTKSVAPGETLTQEMQLFAGAKEWGTIRNYQNQDGVEKFLDSIDWGWFFFLTKPIFAILHWLNALIGNMGWAIIALTILLKAALLPLAFKSYVSMAKMKELQPEMEKIKEKAGDDRGQMQKMMMELYKKEKVNPASGCLPILLQIPIFFSLYKVIFVTLELRHAPWVGWIKDLSAPDPSSIFNLWGILPWAAPESGTFMALIFIGIMPLLLGVSMWMQQKLNPAPTDPTQKMIFAWMPWVFMFMLGSFASGLVLYWITNNVITFVQQYMIMRSQGYKPDVFGNIKSSFKRDKAEKDS